MTLSKVDNVTMQFDTFLRAGRLAGSIAILSMVVLAGCGSQSLVDSPSSNQNGRVRYLVIHHTSENFADSLAILTEPSNNPVSSHYLIPEPGDATYDERSLKVYRLVPESRRAWHAGKSYWNGEEALNDHSIGIELVNKTYCIERPNEDPAIADPDKLCFYPDFAEDQLSLLFDLVVGILRRHPDIDPTALVGHADIAPDRKVDPGPRFPWQRLYRYGFGAWYDDETVMTYWDGFRKAPPPVAMVQRALQEYGYRIDLTGVYDRQTRLVVRAFQMHFRPMLTTGIIDAESAAVLFALLEKYRPERLEALLEQAPNAKAGAGGGVQDANQ